MAKTLKTRIVQHLVRRVSSVETGVSAVSLNPDLVTEVRWGEHPDFSDRIHLEAAELVAFHVHDPALRSRGGIREEAVDLSDDEALRTEMVALFEDKPTGQLALPTLQDALERISELEDRVAVLEQLIAEK